MDSQLSDIEKQITDLYEQKKLLLNDSAKQDLEEVLKMDWLYGQKAQYDEGLSAAGLTKYNLNLFSKIDILEKYKKHSRFVQLIGTKENYKYTGMTLEIDNYANEFKVPARLSTNNANLFVKTIIDYDLKIIRSCGNIEDDIKVYAELGKRLIDK